MDTYTSKSFLVFWSLGESYGYKKTMVLLQKGNYSSKRNRDENKYCGEYW